MNHRPRCKMKNYKAPRRQHKKNLDDLGFGNYFLDTPPKARSVKEGIDKLNFIKITNFCFEKYTVK